MTSYSATDSSVRSDQRYPSPFMEFKHHQSIVGSSTPLTPDMLSQEDEFNESDDLLSHDSYKLSLSKTSFLLINICLGSVGLLSFPYALANSSFFSLIAMAIICYSMAYTGKLITRCFDAVHMHYRTYPEVGRSAMIELFGNQSNCSQFGFILATVSIILELIGAFSIKIIFVWEHVSYLLSSTSFEYWKIKLICSCVLLPTIWLNNMAHFSFVSSLGVICKVLIFVLITTAFFFNTSQIAVTETEKYPQSVSSFFISIGIFIFSFGSHATFPAIKFPMREPHKFEKILDISFLIMFFIYSMAGIFGALIYGSDTDIIITSNLINEDSTARSVVAKIVVGIIILGLCAEASMIFLVLTEIPEAYVNMNSKFKAKTKIFRTFGFSCLVAISWFLPPYLDILIGFVGLVTTMLTSIICPILFYYGLKKHYVKHHFLTES
eukprot:290025_1